MMILDADKALRFESKEQLNYRPRLAPVAFMK